MPIHMTDLFNTKFVQLQEYTVAFENFEFSFQDYVKNKRYDLIHFQII